MATNRAMLKEAIADAKAVKETAIANAKAALEEAFTPQLKSMLSMKLQEMNDLEEDDYVTDETEHNDKPYSTKKAADVAGYLEEEDTMMEVDLEELLAELGKEDEMEEGLYEAEETEEEEISDEEETEDEGEPIDLEDMTDEDLKSMIEDVIADMIKSGELEAGSESEEAEIEIEPEEVEDEEDVDLAELLREIEEMEGGYLEEDSISEETISTPEFEDALEKLTPEEEKELKNLAIELKKDFKTLTENEEEPTVDDVVTKSKIYERLKKLARKLSISAIALGGILLAYGVGQDTVDAATAGINATINMDPAALAGIITTTLGVIGTVATTPQVESMYDELKEAYSTIKTLKSELNEINLLNAKLLYTNKIFKSKTLNENQKVKVLSSFDKAKNVGEVKMVFETLNEGIKVSKNTINENLGRASKGTMAPNVKKPIVESNEAFLRMQKLAGII